MNTTDAPLQIVVPGFALIVIEGLLVLLTNIVVGVEITTVGFPQGFVMVIVKVITSPLFNVVLVYVLLFEPTFDPLSFH